MLASVGIVNWRTKTPVFFQILLCSVIVVLAVVQSSSEPETSRLAATLFAAVLGALFVGRNSGWCSEVVTVSFLFCLMVAARAVVPTPLSLGNDVILYLRPAAILIVIAALIGIPGKPLDIVPRDRLMWRCVVMCAPLAAGAVTLTGYLLLSRLYLLDTAVLRTTLLNIMLVPAGYIVLTRLQARVESRQLPTVLVLTAFAGILLAQMLGSR